MLKRVKINDYEILTTIGVGTDENTEVLSEG